MKVSKICVAIFAFLLRVPVAAAGPFGTEVDGNYAKSLWQTMADQHLTGPKSKDLELFFGRAKPLGHILELASEMLTLDGHTGFVVVKRNCEEKGATVESVMANRKKYLTSYTVMFQREEGYDPDSINWFWAKYYPDGSLFKKKGKKLAGRIAKGATPDETRGSLFCHSSAGGGDYFSIPKSNFLALNTVDRHQKKATSAI